MFEGSGLAISLPPREMAGAMPPASLFSIDYLADAAISDDLRIAVALVADMCRVHKIPIVLIARPEVFTNSASLAWLQDQLGGIVNHLCITDGMTVRVIPEMRNHVFAYRLGIKANEEAFMRLLHRVPEFILTLESQINTAFSVKLNSKRLSPPTQLVPAPPETQLNPPELYPFVFDPHNPLNAAKRSLSAGPIGLAPILDFERLTYIPLTEVAARDRFFAEGIGAALTRAYFDPTFGIILRMPPLADPRADIAERIAVGLAGLCAAHTSIPRVLTEKIAWSRDDLDSTIFQSNHPDVDGILHGSFDFWRHPRSFYAACASVTVHMPANRRRDRANIRPLLQDLIREDMKIHWLPYDDLSQH